MLKSGRTVYAIANALKRPVTTIVREIKARAVESCKGAAWRVTNRCAYRMECERRQVCAYCLYDGRRQCRFCRLCNSHCPAFVEQRCRRLDSPPFVCNGCADERKCVLRKRYYLHGKAQENYETILSESRTGANVTEGELLAFDAMLRDLTAKGQSVHAAMASNPGRFTVSEKTVYRYINGGLLSTKRGELPRACKIRPRKGEGVEHRVDKTCRVNRTWEDYLVFMEANPGVRVVEMDTVEGARGGKALLTLMSRVKPRVLFSGSTAASFKIAVWPRTSGPISRPKKPPITEAGIRNLPEQIFSMLSCHARSWALMGQLRGTASTI